MRPDVHALAGAYAMDALSGEEMRRFERHLATCDTCTEEVRGLVETAARLGEASARTPPERLRRAVLDEVARTRQVTPAPPGADAVRPARWWRGASGLALAACLALILALGTTALAQWDRINRLQDEQRAVAAVLSAPDAETATADGADGTTGTVVVSEAHGSLVFTAGGLDRLDGEDYQLWLADPGGTVRSAGLLDVAGGQTSAPLRTGTGGAEAVAVSVEPEGGSEQPTTDPMMTVPIPQ
ncbi:anti-sigma factor [Nocardiopsis coralliicola]